MPSARDAQIDADRAVIGEFAFERVLRVEGDSHEGVGDPPLGEFRTEHHVIDVASIILIGCAIHEALPLGDVDEIGARGLAVIDLGPKITELALLVARRARIGEQVMIEVTEHGEATTCGGLFVDPTLENRHLLREGLAVAARVVERTSRPG